MNTIIENEVLDFFPGSQKSQIFLLMNKNKYIADYTSASAKGLAQLLKAFISASYWWYFNDLALPPITVV